MGLTDGWKCPGCGRCYSPGLTECRVCGQGDPVPTAKPMPVFGVGHTLGSPTDAKYDGYHCVKCDLHASEWVARGCLQTVRVRP